jgi:hypothetical protein
MTIDMKHHRAELLHDFAFHPEPREFAILKSQIATSNEENVAARRR